MGKRKRDSPDGLAQKLLNIRLYLDLSQRDMYLALHPDNADEVTADSMKAIIYAYEKGNRLPSLLELLAYSKTLFQLRRIRISVDDLIDDGVNLLF